MAMNPKGRKLDSNGNPIVTKEELKASGMSLRDFLNKERGLTRRSEAAPAKSAPSNVRMRTPSDADISRARSETAKATASRSASPSLNREINREGARQVQKSQEAARAVPSSRMTPRQMESTVKKSPTTRASEHWASRHSKKGN